MTTNPDDDNVYEGKSKVSFADAAAIAIKNAERDLGEQDREYEITLRAIGKAGSSLSDYIALARAGGG